MTVNDKVTKKERAASHEVRSDATSVDKVYEQILLGIVRGEIASETELKSTQLAAKLGVSRTPVVQALQRLAADGIVTLQMNKRAVVRAGAENWLVEIHQMRELLEPHAAAQAAGRIPPEDLARLEALAEKARPHADAKWREAAQEFDFALHLAIAEHAGNLVLGEAIRKCWSYKRLSYTALADPPESVEQGYREHLSLLAALKTGDAETARAAVTFHLRSAALLRPAKRIV
jgi:DNA-binding GntR family transcriptional regulator